MSTYLGLCNCVFHSWHQQIHTRCKQQIQSYMSTTRFAVTYAVHRPFYSKGLTY
jgi:hypothetical protein